MAKMNVNQRSERALRQLDARGTATRKGSWSAPKARPVTQIDDHIKGHRNHLSPKAKAYRHTPVVKTYELEPEIAAYYAREGIKASY